MRFPALKPPLHVRAAFLFVILLWTAGPLQATTLAEIVAAMDSTTPALAVVRGQLARVEANYLSLRAMPNPVLFGERQSLRDGEDQQAERTLGVRQPLGFLWSYPARREAAKMAFAAAEADFEEFHRQLIVDLAQVALEHDGLAQQLALMDTVLAYAANAAKAMQARFALGDISEYDLERIQAEQIRLVQQRNDLVRKQQETALSFVELAGLPADLLRGLDIPPAPEPTYTFADSAIQFALRNRALIRKSDHLLQASRSAYTAGKWDQLPDFSVGAGHKAVDPGFSGVIIEAEIELPLWGQRRAERRAAHAAYRQAVTQRRADDARVQQEVRGAWRHWNAVKQAPFETPVFTSQQAGRALNRGVLMYLQGELSPVELVDVLRSTMESLQSHLELRNAAILANLELRRVTGLTLLEEK